MTTENQKQKEVRCREWIKSLNEDDPGEWWFEQEDMDLIKEALQGWLKDSRDYKPSIQVIIDGRPYEVK